MAGPNTFFLVHLLSAILAFIQFVDSSTPWISNYIEETNLAYVKDSGICETVDGVGQYSGYINVGDKNYLWFWFFESRNDASTDPFVLWLNGGPGCSSMIGLFTESGPCTVNSDGKSTALNPYSWNNYSNILYLDQPFGAGFSTGITLTNSSAAAIYAWTAFQVLFTSDAFAKYKNHQFVLATESYGARFGPVFINHFNSQNELIESGELDGVKVIVSSLMINDGKHDPLINFQGLVTFAQDAPGYGPLVNSSVISTITKAFENTCRGLLQDCYDADISKSSGADTCNTAITTCTDDVMSPAVGDRDPDYLLASSSDNKVPTTSYATYIRLSEVQDAIGATLLSSKPTFDQCDDTTHALFSQSGETGKTFLPELSGLADSGFRILIWGGDADMKANWLGLHQSMVQMSWYGNQTLNDTALTNMSINGDDVAAFAVVDNFTFARVYGAGHTLPAYKPQVAQTIFQQFISNETIHSVETSVTGSSSAAGASSTASSSDAVRLQHPGICALVLIYFISRYSTRKLL
ncbi:alpha/beta-hydrolase [Lentinula aciculospora]|uniref:Alpha/beta-hydrolase n=1 Tax=Lentinula aciculospora TaxID=153920 RepID=A0A9W9APD4_9AGAR|nr:alpha/beta-hydrolase [Lentinula aciculospora]